MNSRLWSPTVGKWKKQICVFSPHIVNIIKNSTNAYYVKNVVKRHWNSSQILYSKLKF